MHVCACVYVCVCVCVCVTHVVQWRDAPEVLLVHRRALDTQQVDQRSIVVLHCVVQRVVYDRLFHAA